MAEAADASVPWERLPFAGVSPISEDVDLLMTCSELWLINKST